MSDMIGTQDTLRNFAVISNKLPAGNLCDMTAKMILVSLYLMPPIAFMMGKT